MGKDKPRSSDDKEEKLEVEIIEARGLARRGRKSDPFCVITFSGDTRKTPVVYNTLNPTWTDVTLLFDVQDKREPLIVDIFIKESGGDDDFLGQVIVDLTTLEDNKRHDLWMDVSAPEGWIDKHGPITGQIHLFVTYHHSKLAELARFFQDDEPESTAPATAAAEPQELELKVLLGNVSEFTTLIWPIIDFYYKQWDLWMWIHPAQSMFGLIVYFFFSVKNTYIPTALALYLAGSMAYDYLKKGGKKVERAVKQPAPSSDTGPHGLKYIKSQLKSTQNGLQATNETIKWTLDFFNWRYPSTSKGVLIGVVMLGLLWTVVPFRYTMMVLTLYLFTRYTVVYTGCWKFYKGMARMIESYHARAAPNGKAPLTPR